MTDVRSPDAPADALEELLQALRPALEFVSRAPQAVAGRAHMPAVEMAGRARELLRVVPTPVASALDQLAKILDSYPALEPGRRPAAARECLALIDSATASDSGPRQPAPEYRPWHGDLNEAQDALARSVQFVKGVGPRRADELRRMGITTVEDLLFHLPFRYEDRRLVIPIARAVAGQSASFLGELVHLEEKIVGRARRRILRGVLKDRSGLMGLVWFNQVAFFRSRFRRGQQVMVYGQVDTEQGGLQIVHPDVEAAGGAGAAAIVPIYHKPSGMSVQAMRKIVRQAVDQAADLSPSVLPAEIAAEVGITDLETALRRVHRPPAETDAAELAECRSLAHRSLIFDELFYLQLGLALRRRATTREAGQSMDRDGPLTASLERSLPFAMTAAQQRVLDEIADDMAQPHPMHRLIQGDVGSGKTVVALSAALSAVQSGRQAAFMAPTELLAEQHYRTLRELTGTLEVRIELVTSSTLQRRRDAVYADLESGAIDIAVGTHALIQRAVTMPALGLGIIDEQHRFGVLQRAALRDMVAGGRAAPDILLMTATPIPRTLSMTVYGDLDVSVLDEMPPGRQAVDTHLVHEAERGRVYATVRREVEAGRQAYIVYPLVESSEKLELRDATTMARELSRTVFPKFRVGLVHGKMKADEKESVMRRFRDGALQILVSTTVVEVGVDVPNATVMVIEHAERFGLSQLHQLRGRVGRGGERSLCLLVTTRHAASGDSQRLAVMRETTDGFAIAEADLQLRGPGEFLGTRQSGLPDFRASNLLRDTRLLVAARGAAITWLDNDPELAAPASASIRAVLQARWAGRLGLAEIG